MATRCAQLGFVTLAPHDRVILRPAAARFAAVGRDADRAVALQRLTDRCHAILGPGTPRSESARSVTDGPDDEEPTA